MNEIEKKDKKMKRQLTWLMVIFLTTLFLTILGVSKVNAQNDFKIGYEMVIDNTTNLDVKWFRTHDLAIVKRNYEHYTKQVLDTTQIFQYDDVLIAFRNDRIYWYCEMKKINKNGKWKSLTKKDRKLLKLK